MKTLAKKLFGIIARFIGRVTKQYYFEDHVRVYPDGIVYNRLGIRRKPDRRAINNYLNHREFYKFVSQFVNNKVVADVGCGSGYGCEILKKSGAKKVYGCDISKHSIKFAMNRYGEYGEFSIQGITDLKQFSDGFFDVTISSEVLEHVKEYNLEGRAIEELKRITRANGLIVIGTPNSEILGNHGFYFDEISNLFGNSFQRFCIFENALMPFDEEEKHKWESRKLDGRSGVIVTESINFWETFVIPKNTTPQFKEGIPPGSFTFEDIEINTESLHNPISWVVISVK